jgi:hypothetical protein
MTQGLQFTGMVELEQGSNITNSKNKASGSATEEDWMMANRRFRLTANKNFDNGAIYSKIDLFNDGVANNSGVDIRELRITNTPFNWLDLSIGKQVSTWGVADMLFINDLFPKNWVANFQGRDMEYLKDSSYSARATSYFAGFTWDIVYTPQFTADTTPVGCYVSTYDPNSGTVIKNPSGCSTNSVKTADSRSRDHQNDELAMMLKRSILGQEIALYYYDGFYKNPKSMKTNSNGQFASHYSELRVYGLSSEGQVGPGIFTFETGYYDSREDLEGKNFMIQNSMLKYLLGYKVDLSANLTVGLQWYQEKMMDYDQYESSVMSMSPNSYAYRKKELHNTYTLRLTYKAQQETLWINLFSYLRPEDHDSFTKFDISKKVNDNLTFVVGANIFTGKDNYRDREFGMLDNDDNVFIRLRNTF